MPVNSETSTQNVYKRKLSTIQQLVTRAVERCAEGVGYLDYPIDDEALEAIYKTLPTSQDELARIPSLTFRQRMIYGQEIIIYGVVPYKKMHGYMPAGGEGKKPRQWGESPYEYIERAVEKLEDNFDQEPREPINRRMLAAMTAGMPEKYSDLVKIAKKSSLCREDIPVYGRVILNAVAEYRKKQEARANGTDKTPRQWGESLYEHMERAVQEHAISLGCEKHPLSIKELATLAIKHPSTLKEITDPKIGNLWRHPEYAKAVLRGILEFSVRNGAVDDAYLKEALDSLSEEEPSHNLAEEEAPASGMRM